MRVSFVDYFCIYLYVFYWVIMFFLICLFFSFILTSGKIDSSLVVLRGSLLDMFIECIVNARLTILKVKTFT